MPNEYSDKKPLCLSPGAELTILQSNRHEYLCGDSRIVHLFDILIATPIFVVVNDLEIHWRMPISGLKNELRRTIETFGGIKQ